VIATARATAPTARMVCLLREIRCFEATYSSNKRSLLGEPDLQ